MFFLPNIWPKKNCNTVKQYNNCFLFQYILKHIISPWLQSWIFLNFSKREREREREIKDTLSDSKDIYNVKKKRKIFLSPINVVLMFRFIKESWIKCSWFQQNILNTDNNQKESSSITELHQISILEWFLKDCVTLKTGIMMLSVIQMNDAIQMNMNRTKIYKK